MIAVCYAKVWGRFPSINLRFTQQPLGYSSSSAFTFGFHFQTSFGNCHLSLCLLSFLQTALAWFIKMCGFAALAHELHSHVTPV